MGRVAQKISKVDNKELLDILNCAFAEEWLAYYQYWIGAKVAAGLERPKVVEEFEEHAGEELKHAGWIADRILQLGGELILDPSKWQEYAKCKYEIPDNEETRVLVEQNLTSERCAIMRYQSICEMCQGKDYETFRMSRKILKEELEHEEEMEGFMTDFKYYL